MFYSDYATNQLLMANLDGSNEQELLRDNVEIPGQYIIEGLGTIRAQVRNFTFSL